MLCRLAQRSRAPPLVLGKRASTRFAKLLPLPREHEPPPDLSAHLEIAVLRVSGAGNESINGFYKQRPRFCTDQCPEFYKQRPRCCTGQLPEFTKIHPEVPNWQDFSLEGVRVTLSWSPWRAWAFVVGPSNLTLYTAPGAALLPPPPSGWSVHNAGVKPLPTVITLPRYNRP